MRPGALHAGPARGPGWLQQPDDVNALVPRLWATSVGRAGRRCAAGRRRRRPRHRRASTALRRTCWTRPTCGRAPWPSGTPSPSAFDGNADVYYAGKAFLCTAVARWMAEDGLAVDTCSGGELAVALRAGVPPERIGLHGNNKSDAEIDRAVAAGIGRVVVDGMDEIARVAEAGRRHGRRVPVLLRVTVGVEAHTHEYIATAHEDQKFGLSLAGGQARKAVDLVLEHERVARPARPALAHRQPDLRHVRASRSPPTGSSGCTPSCPASWAASCPSSTSAAGSAWPTRPSTTRCRRPSWPPGWPTSSPGSARRRGSPCRGSRSSPGRAIAAPSTFTLYSVGTVKVVELDGGLARTYVAVDGGMSDNVRTALYDADYSCTLASRASMVPPVLSRVVGKHCESGDIVVKDEFLPGDVRSGRSGRRTRHRRLLPQHGQPVQPRPATAGAVGAATARSACWSGARPRTTSSPSTSATEPARDSPACQRSPGAAGSG